MIRVYKQWRAPCTSSEVRGVVEARCLQEVELRQGHIACNLHRLLSPKPPLVDHVISRIRNWNWHHCDVTVKRNVNSNLVQLLYHGVCARMCLRAFVCACARVCLFFVFSLIHNERIHVYFSFSSFIWTAGIAQFVVSDYQSEGRGIDSRFSSENAPYFCFKQRGS